MPNVTPSRKRLDSWKQIADYLGCTERTAMRYEAKGIPVYRVGGQKKPHQRVFAYADELDHWLHDGGIGVKVDASSEPESAMDASHQAAHHPRQSASSPLRLDIVEGPESGSSYFLSRPSTIIGRDIEAELVLADPRISRRHAQIQRMGNAFFLEDLNSRNGTLLNGQVFSGRVPLRHSDQIQLGNAATLKVTIVGIGDTVDSDAS